MTEIETKKAHTLALCVEIEAIKERIEASDPEPFFGGLPPLYLQLANALGFHAKAMREKFDLGALAADQPLPEGLPEAFQAPA